MEVLSGRSDTWASRTRCGENTVTLPNMNPDDCCRQCDGTGRVRYEDVREGRTVLVSDTCHRCKGTGSKTVLWSAKA